MGIGKPRGGSLRRSAGGAACAERFWPEGWGGRRKLKRKIYETRPEKIRDFLIGFGGWWVVNGLIWLLIIGVLQGGKTHDVLSLNYGLENLCVLPLNVIALIILALLRRWISLGMLSAVALNLAIALILGLTEYGTCAVPFFAGLDW